MDEAKAEAKGNWYSALYYADKHPTKVDDEWRTPEAKAWHEKETGKDISSDPDSPTWKSRFSQLEGLKAGDLDEEDKEEQRKKADDIRNTPAC